MTMNRNVFTLLIFSLFSIVLQAQEITVPQTQRPLITKRTASWCPFCGGWGWTFFRNVLDDNSGKAVFFANHYDGIHTTPTTLALSANFGGVSQPVFFLNNTNQNVSSGATATARTNIQNQVNTAWATTPVVQSGIRAIHNSAAQTLNVTAKSRFFQSASGEYYLGIYLVFKEFVGFQSPIGNNAEHKEMLRSHLTANAFGEQIANGAVAAGVEAEVSGQISIAGLDPTKLRVVTIIWKKEGTTYRVTNANETDDFMAPSSANDLWAAQQQLKIFPNIITESARIEMQITESNLPWRMELVNTSGQVVETIFQGILAGGAHTFSVERGARPAGLYFVRLSNGLRSTSQRVVLR